MIISIWSAKFKDPRGKTMGSRAVDSKRFLESNASSISGTYFRLGYIKVPRIEEAIDSRNLLPSTALDPNNV